LEAGDGAQSVLNDNQSDTDPQLIRSLYRETQELILTMGLKPNFLLTYKRIAFQSETERVSLDWDIQYYHVDTNVYFFNSWKYPLGQPAGISHKIILELKYPQGTLPAWIAELEKRYPIQETGFLKFVEGMGFLFQGPLKNQKEADSFLQLIEGYGGESRSLG
jgi:SPX domain protein involved in polyphosphate accumulation